MKIVTGNFWGRCSSALSFHTCRPGCKLALLFCFSLFSFFSSRLDIMAAAWIGTLFLYKITGFPFRRAWQQLRPFFWLFAVLFMFQLFTGPWQSGLVIVLRLAGLLLFAGLITLTTPLSQMMASLEHILRFLKPLGINPAKISLTVALTLRFIPLLRQISREVQESRKARGLEGNIIAMLIPLVVRTLKIHEDVAAAIEARCYDDDL